MVNDSGPATTLTKLSDREYVMTRVFDAPRDLVFQAYTDPKHIPHWWGPRTVTTIVDKMDVSPGGMWRYIQRHPDGAEYAFRGEYREVVPPERLVYTFGFEFEFDGKPDGVVLETLTFAEHDGTTMLTASWRFQSVADRDGMLGSGLEAGMTESWDRLAQLVESLTNRPVTRPPVG